MENNFREGNPISLHGTIAAMKRMQEHELRELASQYGISLSSREVKRLRPLLDEVSPAWILTGVPDAFIWKVRNVIGDERTQELIDKYL